jgi:2'-5' RNA ligase
MIRLFVALEIPDNIREFITEERRKISNAELRWEPAEKLHLTLKFIGEFREELLNNLIQDLFFIEYYQPFNLHLTDFGFFQQRIIWTGITGDDKLFNLIDDLNKKLVKFNIPVEDRKFKPHLTLLRIPKDRGNEIIQTFRGKHMMKKTFTSSQVILFRSDLTSKGSKYTPLQVYKLKSR